MRLLRQVEESEEIWWTGREWQMAWLGKCKCGLRERQRGRMCHIHPIKRKRQQQTKLRFKVKIRELEKAYATTPTERIFTVLRQYRLKLNEFVNKRSQFLLGRLRYDKFEHSNKTGKYLANQLKQNTGGRKKTLSQSSRTQQGSLSTALRI